MKATIVRLLAGGLVIALLGLIASASAPGSAATTFTVTSVDDTDDGTCDAHCTLREAINAANALAGADEIDFNIAPGGAQTIAVDLPALRALPAITDTATIDGTTQPGYAGTPLIEISGASATQAANGLEIAATAPGSVIRGVLVNGFDRSPIGEGSGGIVVYGDDAIIEENFVGTSLDGTQAVPNDFDIWVEDASGAIIRSNLISGAPLKSLYLVDSVDATITDNLIGTDPSGNTFVAFGGVVVQSSDNVAIGTPGHGNVITAAIRSEGTAVSIEDNLIGVDAAGTTQLRRGGVAVDSGEALIRGNVFAEVEIGEDASATVAGNKIGVDATGTVPFEWYWWAVRVFASGPGLASVIEDNVIGGRGTAIGIYGDRPGHIVRRNFIGTDASATIDLGNDTGVEVSGPSDVVIGGATAGDGNIIAHNSGAGVAINTKPAGSSPGVRIRNNSIHSNGGKGIVTAWGEFIPRPRINTLSPLAGTACASCVIDIYSDDEDDARVLEVTVVADASGNWSWAGVPAGPCIGVTSTPSLGWTSEITTRSLAGGAGNNDGEVVDLAPLIFDDATSPNADGVTDDCDGDDDNDGLPDDAEESALPCASASGPLDPLQRDSDGDYISDGLECGLGTDPLNPLSSRAPSSDVFDLDGDRILAHVEALSGTSDTNRDSDNDGCIDPRELASVNGDRIANSIDLAQVAMRFGDYEYPDPAYYLNLDINRDGRISSIDLSLIANAFGLQC
jgi:CSLREA domain-containing protein